MPNGSPNPVRTNWPQLTYSDESDTMRERTEYADSSLKSYQEPSWTPFFFDFIRVRSLISAELHCGHSISLSGPSMRVMVITSGLPSRMHLVLRRTSRKVFGGKAEALRKSENHCVIRSK